MHRMHRRSQHTGARQFATKARETLGPAAEQAIEKLGPQLGQAREQIGPQVKEARERLEPLFDEAMERLLPYVEEARHQASDKLAPAAEQAAKEARTRFLEDVVPALSAAVAAATEASEPFRDEAKKRGTAAFAAIKGEVEAPSKKSHKLRNLVLLLGLGGLAAYLSKKFAGGDNGSAWQSSYEPTPAPPASAPRPTAVPDPGGQDAGAATPDEALADAEEHPHKPTDPNEPLEKKDLE